MFEVNSSGTLRLKILKECLVMFCDVVVFVKSNVKPLFPFQAPKYRSDTTVTQ